MNARSSRPFSAPSETVAENDVRIALEQGY